MEGLSRKDGGSFKDAEKGASEKAAVIVSQINVIKEKLHQYDGKGTSKEDPVCQRPN